MAEARRQPTTSGGPAGWVILLGLMFLALVIAAVSKGCADDDTSPAAISPGTETTGTSTGAGALGVDVIDQVNQLVRATPVVFVTGKTELTPASRTVLDQVATILVANEAVNADVRGYTDDQGDDAKNRQLSQERAQAVVDYLVTKGVIAARLTATGLGEADPIADNSTEAGRAKNRRVEFAPG